MEQITIFTAFHQALWAIILAVTLITLPTLIVGIIISIFQAATQINEMSLTFILKLMTLFIVLFSVLFFLFNKLVEMTQDMFFHLPNYLR